jgi:hypothetical protein
LDGDGLGVGSDGDGVGSEGDWLGSDGVVSSDCVPEGVLEGEPA